MRVRISYSVDLEDVPDECAEKLQKSLLQINEVHAEIEDLIDQLGTRQCEFWIVKRKIARCRENLAKLDNVLADNELILEGYYSTKNSNQEVEDVSSEG